MTLERINDLLLAYRSACERLDEIVNTKSDLQLELSVISDALIQRFEFTFELAWKLLKESVEFQGSQPIRSPRQAIKEAFQMGLISNGEAWIDMLGDRNLCSHTYDEAVVSKINQKIHSHYSNMLKSIIPTIEKITA